MKIGILNYNACNLASIYHSIFRIGYDPIIIEEKDQFKNLDKLIIPGVGAANSCLNYLKKKKLFDEVDNFLKKKKPILGICLGLQIFSKKLHEHGLSDGFNFIDAEVVPFRDNKINIGWSELIIENNNKWKNLDLKSFYFCHSYYLKFLDSKDIKFCHGFINFHEKVPSLIVKNNFMGVQFHPEKSQTNGNKFIENFLNWEPKID